MRVCNRCLYSEIHPLHLAFDEEGICSGCRVHEEKDILDWALRRKKLESIFSDYKSKTGRNYDCIIPVSGARDSYYIVHVVKNIFGMNPLLVSYNKHYNTAVGFRNLSNLKIKFNCDLMMLTINPEIVKKITRATLRRFGSIYWHCIAGQTVFPVQIAVKMKIPLIIWGAHQGIDQVGMFSHFDEVEMTRKYRKEHDLMGYEAEDLIEMEFDNLSENDLLKYFYPDNRELENVGIRGIYLNNYMRWDSRLQHEEMIRLYDYETAKQNRTFDYYNDIDCWLYSDIHDYIKLVKHGYGKVVDQACREIRLRHLSKSEATKLVRRYLFKPPQNLKLFCDWLGITENGFFYILDQHRNSLFWTKDDNWNWINSINTKLSYDSNKNNSDVSFISESFKKFILTGMKKSTDNHDEFLLIGKGYE